MALHTTVTSVNSNLGEIGAASHSLEERGKTSSVITVTLLVPPGRIKIVQEFICATEYLSSESLGPSEV